MTANDPLDPTVFVIFGGAGDLTRRKLIPAMFDLSLDRSLPSQFAIIVVDRMEFSHAALRRRLHEGVREFSRFGKPKASIWDKFSKHIQYQAGDFKKSSTYTELRKRCEKYDVEFGDKLQHVYYMATPPSMFCEIPKYLGKAGMTRDRGRSRIVIEKPIGYDLKSARALDAVLSSSFVESQIFRITAVRLEV